MSLRDLLLYAAVPVSAETERSAARHRHVHHVLRGDGVLSRVFGHVTASAAQAATCRDVGLANARGDSA
ncbi:hypothetical protein FJT64_025096 [Amphibalanus amphitrite]|uniref:Uncharacterized protein n=1 Tax=Amphibalanus amphitrite TaxID=1232801 RepID=A0A6A4W4N8_AMPAM|nr:hypothetical protein FJT64_025096 [Amphibalanus amphitrite]